MINTTLTRMFDLRHPIVLAPMGGVAGGALAAAVSNAGGLGMVGGGYGDIEWLRRELALAGRETTKPWGAGLITWSLTAASLDLVLEHRPAAVMLSFGDPRPYAAAIRASGCRLICQVQDVADALVARDAGADLIVAEGCEAGGHGGKRSTLPLVPAVVDAVSPIPVVAAGGIADGRGLAAALMLGAQGALVGTRFCATPEALLAPGARQRLVAAGGSDTAQTRVFDIVRGLAWPEQFAGRALRNRFVRQWHGREAELEAAAPVEHAAYYAAVRDEDYETAFVWAGEALDLIDTIDSAGAIVARVSAEAEACLGAGHRLLG